MKNTISLKLIGDVSLSDFSEVMGHLSSLIDNLTFDVGEKAEIEWEIARLEGGSATAVIVGKSFDEEAIIKVVQAYEVIGEAIANDTPIPYAEPIAKEARAITGVLNGKITSLKMSTDEFEAFIDHSVETENEEKEQDFTFGTITGWVETLSKRGQMRFILYDTLFDRAVECHIAKDQEHLLLEAWDKKITVAGKVYRDPETGRPFKVRDINYIEVKREVPPGSFMDAEGVVPWKDGDEYPEEIIRRYRDAQ